MGGLDGLGGRMGGQETTSGDWDGLSGGFSSPFAKVRVAGSNTVVRSVVRSIRRPLHFAETQVTRYPVQPNIS